MPNSGHWIMEENPQATIKLVTDFLAEASAACSWDPGVTQRCSGSAASWDALARRHLDFDLRAWMVQEVTHRLPDRIDHATTTFASAKDLASAMRRAAAAHGEHEKRNGQRDANCPDWYAGYIAAEQAGTELPQ